MSPPVSRFWTAFDPVIARSLSADQRAEIERVFALDPSHRPSSIGDLRLPFHWFFVRIMWGPEKRGADRLQRDGTMYPALTRKNVPGIVTVGVAYTAFWYATLAIGVGLVARYVLR